MNKEKRLKISRFLRNFARTILLVLGLLLFIFSLLSGADKLGGGIIGIIYNSPNALPWLMLLIFIYIAFRWEIIGGVLILSMGAFTIYFFDVTEFCIVFWGVSVPLIFLGVLLLIAGYLEKR